MKKDAIRRDDSEDLPELEKRILAVLSLFETNPKQESSNEYVLPGNRRIRPTLEGIKSFLKEGASIDKEKMHASIEQLLSKELITSKSDCYFLSDHGKKVGKRFRIERLSKGYDDLLSRTGSSKAYSMFCERVFGKDLSQFNVLDMEQLNTLIEKLELKPGEVALDLGCGNGRVAEYISDRTGAKLVGLDFAARLIESAQQRTVGKKDRLTYLIGNMDELSLEDGSFDAIISIDSLYFVESIDSTIRNLKRLLKQPHGRLAIFYDQSCNNTESRDVLLPENTKVGKALKENGMTFQAIDFTANSKRLWIREIEAAEQLKQLFEKEGNLDIYEDRAQDAKQTLETIEDSRHVRYYYLARL